MYAPFALVEPFGRPRSLGSVPPAHQTVFRKREDAGSCGGFFSWRRLADVADYHLHCVGLGPRWQHRRAVGLQH